MMPEKTSTHDVQSAITDEIFFALGLKRRGILRQSLGWLFAPATRPFARTMVAVDDAVAKDGPPAGAGIMMDRLGVDVYGRGQHNIPLEGPIVLLSNHPGAYDSIAIISLLTRNDLGVIVSRTRFYEVIPNIYPHLITVSAETSERMLVVKKMIEHLKRGKMLLQFGSGLIEPDPANHPIGDDVFARWSGSLEILLRKVPETRVVPTIASGVLMERFENHFLTRLRKREMDKRRLAEFMQIIRQLVRPKSIHGSASISFGPPFTLGDLNTYYDEKRIMPVVIERMRIQLEEHLKWVSSSTIP